MAATIHMSSPLGNLEIESSGRAINRIEFIGHPVLETEALGDTLTNLAAAQLMEYFNGGRQAFDFPIQQEGTVFQQKVWAALAQIPFGQTISYITLARRLNDEKCIRAAASANGKNRLAIVVPCHRVIGSNGSLVGYAGGLWRKKWLLEHEAKLAGKLTQASLF